MTLGESLRNAARNLINTFGNSGTVYSYSGVTKTTSNEGDVAITDWKTGTNIKIVDGSNAYQLIQAIQGLETIGEDEKIIRDDVTIVLNDRLKAASVDFKVIEVRPLRAQDTLIAQAIRVSRVTSTTVW